MNQYSDRARMGALVICVIAAATLMLRVYLRLDEPGGLLGAFAYLSQYFTILTNGLVCLVMGMVAVGRGASARVLVALTISIACVGMVYHAVLAHLLDLSGLSLLADHGVHTVVPLLTVLWWLGFAPKGRFTWGDLAAWTLWPLIYCIYILARAAGSGFYPYPFLNLTDLGAQAVGLNVVLLCLAFVVVGLCLTFVGRILGRGQGRGTE